MCGLKAQLSTEWISKHCMNWCGKIKSFYWLVFRYWANKLDRHWQLCGISSPGLKCRTMLLVKSVVQQFFFVFVINKYLEFTFLFLKLLYCRKKNTCMELPGDVVGLTWTLSNEMTVYRQVNSWCAIKLAIMKSLSWAFVLLFWKNSDRQIQ